MKTSSFGVVAQSYDFDPTLSSYAAKHNRVLGALVCRQLEPHLSSPELLNSGLLLSHLLCLSYRHPSDLTNCFVMSAIC